MADSNLPSADSGWRPVEVANDDDDGYGDDDYSEWVAGGHQDLS